VSLQDWYYIDEYQDVLSSLLVLENAVVACEITQLDVKWAIIAAHSALQGACVCLLTRTDGGGALGSTEQKKLEDYHLYQSQKTMCEKAGIPLILTEPEKPRSYLAPLNELALRLPLGLRFSIAKLSEWPKDEATRDFTLLSRWRNEFAHYSPAGWSIELAGLPRILGRVISKIEQIATHNGFQRHNDFQDTEILEIIARIRVKLNSIESQ
jgi:hypothetical protein